MEGNLSASQGEEKTMGEKSQKQPRAKAATPLMASSSSSSAAPQPPPPPPLPSAAKKSFLRRIFPLLLTANVAVGAYVLARTWKKEPDEESTEKVPSSPVVNTEAAVSLPAPVKVRPPIPEHEQRELYKWILEERRKVKPRNSAEKKKIDEEKALLKQIIRAESIPSL